MSLPIDLLANAKAFFEAATNLVGFIENNVNALFRIKEKVKLETEINHIERVLSIFPELMFFNGEFITSFSPAHVMSAAESEDLAAQRDRPAAAEFEKQLNVFSGRFDKHAPHIHGLGTNLVVLFKRGIELRRSLLEEYHSTERKQLTEEEIHNLRVSLSKVYPIEKKLYDIKSKLKAQEQE